MRKPVQTSTPEPETGITVSFPAGSFDAQALQASLDAAAQRKPEERDAAINDAFNEHNQTAIADVSVPIEIPADPAEPETPAPDAVKSDEPEKPAESGEPSKEI
jgi:hypothetical protein